MSVRREIRVRYERVLMTVATARNNKPDLRSHHLRPEKMQWQKTRFPGCEMKPLMVDTKSGLATLLFKMAPGAELPDHEHVLVRRSLIDEMGMR